jgi:hypothetical protein
MIYDTLCLYIVIDCYIFTNMSDKPYEKECIFCKNKITMSNETGKWLPYNNDGSSHDCRTNGKTNGQTKQTKQEITLEMVQKKLESIGIIINIERLMKQE